MDPQERPSIDVGSEEFSVATQYHNAPDLEAQEDAVSVHSTRSRGSTRSRRSLRSFISRKTKDSTARDDEKLKSIEEEDEDESTLNSQNDEWQQDLTEARLEDQGGNSEEIEKYKKRMERHRNIQQYTRHSTSVKWLRKVYDDILSRTLLTRSFIWWLPLALILFIPLAIDAWAKKDLYLGHVRVMWIFIWLEVSWGALFVARQFAHYMPGILGFFVAIIAPGYFFLIDALFALEYPVTLFFWLFVTFITFKPITATNPKALDPSLPAQEWQNVLQNVLVAFFLSGLFYLLEQLFIHMLSVSYHKTRIASRIKDNRRSISIISQLLFASWQYFPAGCPDFVDEDKILSSSMIAVSNNAGKKMKKMFNKVDVNLAKAAAAVNFLPNGFSGTQKDADRMTREALPNSTARQVLAERIWKSLVLEGHNELDMEDILVALGKENNEDSMYIFDLLDLDGQGSISLEEMVAAVRGIGKESRNISRALQDMDGAITKLHYLLLVMLAIIVIVIFIGMVAPSAATVLATFGTTILGFSFVFSSTAAEILSSCVFLFVKHPIDIGDVVNIDCGTLGHTRLIVRSINLLSTVFEDANDNTRRQASNSVLNTLFIDNVTRSPPQGIVMTLTLGLPETTFEHLEKFRTRLNDFLLGHPRDYQSVFYYQVIGQPDLDRIQLMIIVYSRNNSVDSALFGIRRTRFFEFVSRSIHDVPLHIPKRDAKYNDPATPFYTEQIDHTNRPGPRKPFGMFKSNDDDAGSSTGVRRANSFSSSATTGKRKRVIQNFAPK